MKKGPETHDSPTCEQWYPTLVFLLIQPGVPGAFLWGRSPNTSQKSDSALFLSAFLHSFRTGFRQLSVFIRQWQGWR